MTAQQPRNILRRIVQAMPTTRGAIDLASVMVGVIILAIASTVIIASIVSAVPWSKQVAAKANLSSVQTAENAARIATGSYLTVPQLQQQGFLAKPNTSYTAEGVIQGGRGLSVLPRSVNVRTALPDIGAPLASVGNGGACYVAAVLATDGLVYWLSSDDTSIRSTDPKNAAPDTSSCAKFPPVAPFPGPPLTLDYTTQAFDSSKSDETLAPTVANGSNDQKFTLDIDKATLPQGIVFDEATGKFTHPGAWPARAKQVVVSQSNACVLTSAGGVKCWGRQYAGANGDGVTTNTNVSSPQQVVGLTSGVTKIAVGNLFGCAVMTDQTLKCWGVTYTGTGSGNFASPQPVALTGVVDVAAGVDSACAVLNTGGVRCWGANTFYQIGGTGGVKYTPQTMMSGAAEFTDATSIAGSTSTYCVTTKAAGVKCWGRSERSQAGNGSTANVSAPFQVPALTSGVSSIIVGGQYACALIAADGTVQCWGDNTAGQMATVSGGNATTPQTIAGLPEPVVQISGGSATICTLSVTNVARCWGQNSAGETGIGSNGGAVLTPTLAGVITAKTTSISIGASTGCMITDGVVQCYGSNSNLLLGDGNSKAVTYNTATPVQVVGFTGTPGLPVIMKVTLDDSGQTVWKQVRLSVN